jgi:excisionase family DNA binding protein
MADTKQHNPEGFITYPELCKRLRMCKRSIEKLVERGVISRIKIGKCVRFDWKIVEEELKNASKENVA